MAATLGIATLETQVDLSGMKRGLDSGEKQTQSWLSNAGNTVSNALGKVVKYAAVAAAGALAVVIHQGIEFESAWAGVVKTTDGLTDSVGNLTEAGAELQQGFRNLSKEIPIAVDELMGIGELGGQLGIAKDDLLSFTETIAMVGVTTNLTSEEAATSFAQFGNVMGSTQDDLNRFASSVVELGNNMATTEGDIVAMSSRLAGAGRIAGLTEADIAGISAAFASVGVTAEVGGTAVQKVLNDMSASVATGGGKLEGFAKVAGMTASEFSEMWQNDAAGAFTAFVEGLGAAGDDAIGILDELEYGDSRLIRSFLSLANAGDLLADAIGMSNEAFEDNTALAAEAAQRFATTESKIALFKNTLRDLGTSIYLATMPAIQDFLDGATELTNKFSTSVIPVIASFVNNLQEGMTPLNAFIEAIWDIAPPSVLDALTQLRDQILPNLFALFEEYIQPVIDFIASFVEWKDVLLVLGVAIMGVVLPALWAIASPFLAIGALIAAGILLVAALRTAWEENFLGIQDLVGGVWQAIEVGWMAFQALFEGDWETFLFRIGIAWQVAWNAITEFVNNIWVIIEPYLTQFYDDFIAWWEAIDWYAVGENVANYLVDGITLAGQLIGLVILKFTELYTAVVEWFKTQDWETAGNAVTDKIKAVWEGFSSVIAPILQGWWDAFVTWFESVEWKQLALDAVMKISNGYASFVESIGTTLAEWYQSFVDWVNNADWEAIATTTTETIIDGLISFIENVVPTLQEWYGSFNDWVLEQDWEAIAKGIVGGIVYFLSGQWANDIVNAVKEWFTKTDDEVGKIRWKDIGVGIISGVIAGITSKIGDLVAAVKGAAQQAMSSWRDETETHSPSRVFAEYGRFIIQGLMAGIEDEEATLYDKIRSVASGLSGTFNGIVTGIKNFSLKPLEKEIEKTEKLLQGATANVNNIYEEMVLNPEQLSALRTQRDEVRNLQDQIDKYKNLELGASLSDAERQIILKNLQADLKDSVTALETLKGQLGFSAFDELSRQEQIAQYFAALKSGNTELAQAIQHVWDVQRDLNGATAEYEDQQAAIAKLQEKQQQFAFLQSQLDLINQLTEAGLNPDEILNGITLGLDASEDDLLAAMTATIEALIAQAEGVLGIASPSKVFAKIGQFTGEGLAEGINQTFGLVNRAADSLVNSIIPTDAPQLVTNTPPTRSQNGGDTYIITIEKGATITESDVRNIFEKVRRSEGRRVDVSRRQ